MVLLRCMFSELTIWYSTTNRCVLPWVWLLSHSTFLCHLWQKNLLSNLVYPGVMAESLLECLSRYLYEVSIHHGAFRSIPMSCLCIFYYVVFSFSMSLLISLNFFSALILSELAWESPTFSAPFFPSIITELYNVVVTVIPPFTVLSNVPEDQIHFLLMNLKSCEFSLGLAGWHDGCSNVGCCL